MAITRGALTKAIGGPFVTRLKLAGILGYKSAKSVDKYLDGLQRIGSRYLTEDVIDRLLREVER